MSVPQIENLAISQLRGLINKSDDVIFTDAESRGIQFQEARVGVLAACADKFLCTSDAEQAHILLNDILLTVYSFGSEQQPVFLQRIAERIGNRVIQTPTDNDQLLRAAEALSVIDPSCRIISSWSFVAEDKPLTVKREAVFARVAAQMIGLEHIDANEAYLLIDRVENSLASPMVKSAMIDKTSRQNGEWGTAGLKFVEAIARSGFFGSVISTERLISKWIITISRYGNEAVGALKLIGDVLADGNNLRGLKTLLNINLQQIPRNCVYEIIGQSIASGQMDEHAYFALSKIIPALPVIEGPVTDKLLHGVAVLGSKIIQKKRPLSEQEILFVDAVVDFFMLHSDELMNKNIQPETLLRFDEIIASLNGTQAEDDRNYFETARNSFQILRASIETRIKKKSP